MWESSLDPTEISMIATAAMAAGGIVFCGALYAIFYALGRQGDSRRFRRIGYASYAGLVVCAALLTGALDLRGIWLAVMAALLLGYLMAPPFIWRLCNAVHRIDDVNASAEVSQ